MVDARVLQHREFQAGYRELVLKAPAIAARVAPGQFIHLRVPRLENCVLRRPFSVFAAAEGAISVLFKPVGLGTEALATVREGETLSIMGPLGRGFPAPDAVRQPVLVAGGYGVAPLCFLAARTGAKGLAFIGAATAGDLLCERELTALGWEVRLATDDGSAGVRGLVTAALDPWRRTRPSNAPAVEYFACGPDGMLRAVAERAGADGSTAWLSLDKHMGCGMGACLACVQRLRKPDGSEVWGRVCRDGPVFEAREIVWPQTAQTDGPAADGRRDG
jgi:dihydroorotate dehydrogenase electron transfer subunit